MKDFADGRRVMVDQQLRCRGISDDRVLRAMSEVRREIFVATELADHAYDDEPLPIASGQTISQPYMVALMLEAAQVRAEDRVLEVGTGSGYAAALLSCLASSVHTIERDATLFASARAKLDGTIHTRLGDGSLGWPDAAPFDVILVAAAAATPPTALLQQLAEGGRMIMPIGGRLRQRLIRLTRRGEKDYREDDLGAVMFVPLI